MTSDDPPDGITDAEVLTAWGRVDSHFRRSYGVGLEEFDFTDTPGYWRFREPCGGSAGGCRNELHSCALNEGPIHHTASYFDPNRVNNRFSSPTKTWRLLREAGRDGR